MNTYYVYILTNKNNQVFYIGVTNDIVRRTYEHKNKLVKGFTERYNVTKLVYVESCNSAMDAIEREKKLKKWSHQKKQELIERNNPNYDEIPLQ